MPFFKKFIVYHGKLVGSDKSGFVQVRRKIMSAEQNLLYLTQNKPVLPLLLH
jgi:hypothetical protein